MIIFNGTEPGVTKFCLRLQILNTAFEVFDKLL